MSGDHRPGPLKAAVAHLWFVTIHPFEDGNGRIARAIADMALARSEGTPRRFYSMSAQIRVERKAYYEMLERTQKGDLDITAWMPGSCLPGPRLRRRGDDPGLGAAQGAVLGRARRRLNDRQRIVLNRLLDGFEGKLTTSKYAILAKCSQDTAARDIDDLSRKGILVRDPAGGRSTSYSVIADAADAFEAVARWVIAHADKAVWEGAEPAKVRGASGTDRTGFQAIGRELQVLARSDGKSPTYWEFESRLRTLHELGFFPDARLVAAVAETTRRDL